MKRKPTLKSAKKRAWDALSKCIRYSEAQDGIHATCVSCGIASPWKEMDAGHWLPKKKGTAVYFFPPNCHAQHKMCNKIEGGSGGYAVWMLRNYGEGMMQRIVELGRSTLILRVHDYIAMAEFYERQFEQMQEARAAGHVGYLKVEAYL